MTSPAQEETDAHHPGKLSVPTPQVRVWEISAMFCTAQTGLRQERRLPGRFSTVTLVGAFCFIFALLEAVNKKQHNTAEIGTHQKTIKYKLSGRLGICASSAGSDSGIPCRNGTSCCAGNPSIPEGPGNGRSAPYICSSSGRHSGLTAHGTALSSAHATIFAHGSGLSHSISYTCFAGVLSYH